MALCRSLAMRAEKRARLGRMRGLALRQTSMTYRHRPGSALLHTGHQARLQVAAHMLQSASNDPRNRLQQATA